MSISTLPSAQSSTLNVFWKGDNKFQKQVPGEKRTLASVYSIGLNFPTHTLTAEVPPQLLSRNWTVLSMKVQAESESTDHTMYPCSCDTLAATQKVIITILHFHEDFRHPGQFIPNAQPHPFAINIKPNTICFEPGSQYGLYVSLGINGFEASFGVIKDSKDQSHGAIQTPVLIKQPKLPAPVVDPRYGLAAVASALPIGVSIVCAPHQTLKLLLLLFSLHETQRLQQLYQ